MELVAGKGLLELLGFTVGKGLTLLFNCNDNKNNFTRHEIIISASSHHHRHSEELRRKRNEVRCDAYFVKRLVVFYSLLCCDG